MEYFVSTPEKYAGDARTRLEMAWGITDRASADSTINWLLTSGHRSGFQEEMGLLSLYGISEWNGAAD